MTRRRPWYFWLILAGFLVGALWWTVEVPDYRRDLARLVPPQATVVALTHGLADAWQGWLANPVAAGLLMGFQDRTNLLERWRADDGLADFLRRVAPSEVALAYVPHLGPKHQPAYLLVSWLGGHSQRLRWLLKSGRVAGATRVFNRNGNLVWRLATRDLPPERHLTIAVVEGMAVLCLSDDLGSMIEVLDGHDGLLPAPPPGRPAWPVLQAGELRLLYRPLGAYTPAADVWRGAVRECRADRLVATLAGPWPAGWPTTGSEPAVAPAWNPGDGPAVLRLTLDRELALYGAQQLIPGFTEFGGELVRHDARGPLRAALIDGPFAGRARGLKLPTVVGSLPIASEPAVTARLDLLLDQLNARHRWGLVKHEQGAGPFRPVAVESTSETPYARFALNEQLAWLVTNGSLVVASNVEGFTNLLQDARAAVRAPAAAGLPAGGPAVADLWMDLAAGGKSVRMLLATWSLQVDERDAARARRVRDGVAVARQWLDALAPLGVARAVMRREGAELVVDVEMGSGT